MAYRDVLFRPLTSVFLLGGLERTTTDALPEALHEVARRRSSARRRWPGPVLRASRVPVDRLERLVAASVHHASGEVTDVELIAAARAHGFAGLPIALTIAGGRCVVLTAHAVYDGTGSLDLVHDLLDVAGGRALGNEPPAARLPVLQALRHVRLRDVRSFVAARIHRPRSTDALERRPAPGATAPRRTTSTAFRLTRADLAALRRYREPGRTGRPTIHSRLADVMVAALREVATADGDVPVWMTTDLRHLVDGAVHGNFIGREQIGTLEGEQWAPGALAVRLVRLKGSGQALSLVWSTTGWLLRSAIGRRPTPGEEIVLTLASTQRDLPVPVGSVLATSLGGSPTFGFAWRTKGETFVSVYNASGRFDLERFEGVFRDLVRRRADG